MEITEEDKAAYRDEKISKYYWDLLNQADNEWTMASEYDYTQKAKAHFIAITIRQMYNPNLKDNFDYTFGTGSSAIDDGDLGNYLDTHQNQYDYNYVYVVKIRIDA